MPRYATQEHIDKIAELSSDIIAWNEMLDEQIKEIAGFIEAYELTFPVEDRAGIETRLITGEGRDDEKWRGNLLAASPIKTKVNVWCLSLTNSQGLPLKDMEVNEIKEPISIAVDYCYDWDFGTDAKNSEAFFNKKVNGFERILHEIRTCLPSGATIEGWLWRRMIKRFTNASTHIAKGDLAFTLEGI